MTKLTKPLPAFVCAAMLCLSVTGTDVCLAGSAAICTECSYECFYGKADIESLTDKGGNAYYLIRPYYLKANLSKAETYPTNPGKQACYT